MRVVLTVFILLAVIAWLVLSYLPQAAAALPPIAFPAAVTGGIFPALAVVSLAVFLGLQLWLVADTDAVVKRWLRQAEPHAEPFRLSRAAELLWTALPILMTLALAVAGYRWWAG